jgi:uncharacterized protein DUF4190
MMSRYGGPLQARRTNSAAIGSLVLGVLGMTGLAPLSVVAIVLGRRAIRQVRETGEDGYGIARAGVILGWIAVTMMILGLLLILPSSCSGP